ncbi:hypothetical protein JW824_02920 [bacterium]|nr:hypothetical protein [bacterium]
MLRVIHTNKICQLVLCVFVAGGAISVFSQSADMAEALSLYEGKMNQSAKQWLDKDFAKAKDGFNQAQDILSDNMPPPSDSYMWAGFCALKTYTLLLIRMVEVDQHCGENQSELCKELVSQAIHWSYVLIDQARTWNQTQPSRPDGLPSRTQWLKRFQSAILRAQRLNTS